MKPLLICLTLALIILCASASGAQADFRETDWRFFKEIQPPQPPSSEYAYFQVDGEIYDGCSNGLQSLRIVDAGVREVPYQVVTKPGKEARQEFSATILNNSYLPGQYNSFVIDTGAQRPRTNEIEVLTKSKNFMRRASVEGSDNQTDWNVLNGEAYIFDYSRDINSQHLRIEFPLSSFRYLRVKVLDDGTGSLELTGAKVFSVTKEEAQTEQWPLTILKRREDGGMKTTELILDAKYRGLPLRELGLDVADRNYHRAVEVYSGEDREQWTFLGTGVIYNYDMPNLKKSSNRVSFGENTAGGYFKVVIQNHDDRPLDITSVTGAGLIRRVIFPVAGAMRYRVYFGNSKARTPLYDLTQRTAYIETEHLPRFTLSARKPNDKYVETWSEAHPYLLWVAMGIVILFLASLIFNLMRKTPPATSQE